MKVMPQNVDDDAVKLRRHTQNGAPPLIQLRFTAILQSLSLLFLMRTTDAFLLSQKQTKHLFTSISSPFILRTTDAFLLPQQQTQRLVTSISSPVILYCQLLGMNCANPTDYVFSFQGFCQRGGVTDIHSDGWGLCFYQDKGVRTFTDTEAASTSPIASFLSEQYPIQTLNMISHIRYATRGAVDLHNVHPFQREMVCVL